MLANPRVQRRQRLIEQQQAWAGDQRTGQSHALALATGQLLRVTTGEVIQLNQLQHFLDPLLGFAAFDLLHALAEGDVLLHGHIGEQRVALEHHADAALLRGNGHQVLAVEQNLPAIDPGQAGDTTQQGGFAAAGRAEQGDEFTLGDLAVDVAENRGIAVALVQALNTQITHDFSLFRRLAAQVISSTNMK